ncbi:MerR family transcriptional regulator [Mangrovivirga sp. M17]|uniref:MerR family transcriptional regulator n=1 Tax=Mangrovivirga halotolerans TaxID=2993936 RepID=A0ABT3RSW2_9BACT|nr:MerR family transcriptional regulator [Mangrovivirga halotolerans]MCX2744721.1 MerR family transcriptional regulator [Mangrovivirga halotolerans]
MVKYSIKDLEQLSGIKAHTLRIWEQRYNILNPQRTVTNIRYYTDRDLKSLLNIALLNQHGYKISKIAEMPKEERNEIIKDLVKKPENTSSQVNSLTVSMLELDEIGFEEKLNKAIQSIGLEQTMLKVLLPFMQKIGVLWQIGSINPAQEHFISNLIVQKIYAAIDKLGPYYANSDKKTFLLWLAEGEYHELMLLFANYLLKSRGYKVIYLGANLPFEDLKTIYEQHTPDVLFTVFTTSNLPYDISKYIEELVNISGKSEVLVSGSQLVDVEAQLPGKVQVIPSLDKFISMI